MKTLQEYKAELLADGIIDANEVKELEQLLFTDGKIDSEEGDGQIDILERELLLQLKSQAKNFPAKLEELL